MDFWQFFAILAIAAFMSVDAAKARTSEKAAVLRSEQTNQGSFARKWCREIEQLRGKHRVHLISYVKMTPQGKIPLS